MIAAIAAARRHVLPGAVDTTTPRPYVSITTTTHRSDL